MPLGRLEDTQRQLELALDLDPLGLWSRTWLLVMLWLKREAIEQGRLLLLEIEPSHVGGRPMRSSSGCTGPSTLATI